MNFFWLLFAKDCRFIIRRQAEQLSVLGFSLLLMVVGSFAFRSSSFTPKDLGLMAPGLLWMCFFFGAVSVLNQSFLFERENRALEGLLSAGAPVQVFLLAKIAINFIYLLAMLVVMMVVQSLLLGVDLGPVFGTLLLLSVVGVYSFTVLGTVLATISSAIAGKVLLLPLMLYPLCLPLLAAEVFLAREVMAMGYLAFDNSWFHLLVGFAGLVTTALWILSDHLFD